MIEGCKLNHIINNYLKKILSNFIKIVSSLINGSFEVLIVLR